MSDTLGNEIRRLRLEADYTLREFARNAGISAAHQSDIEHGRRMPSEAVLRKIVDLLSHVGATFDALRDLDTRLESDLEQWVQKNPEARQLLRTAKSSGKPIRDVLRDLKALLDEEDKESQ